MHTSSAAVPRVGRAVRAGAVTVLVVSALLSNFAHLKHLWRDDPPPNEFMARRDQRFDLLRDALPKRGTVGYVTDAASWVDGEARLMQAQFGLAPLILVSGADHALVVGEFSDPAAAARNRDPKLTVVRDLGDGLAVFARPGQ